MGARVGRKREARWVWVCHCSSHLNVIALGDVEIVHMGREEVCRVCVLVNK